MPHSFFTRALDLVFPPRPDERLVRSIAADSARWPLPHPRLHEGIWVLLSFSDPTVRALIHEAKFHRNADAIRILGHCLALYLAHQDTTTPSSPCVPVPLGTARERSRGHNQVASIIRAAQHTPLSILCRTRNTLPQTQLSREQRLTNLTDAFAYCGPTPPPPTLLLIDDVITTGATVRAAAHALRKAGVHQVRILALAH